MRRALLMCLLTIVLTSVATIGLRTLPSQSEIPMGGIIIVEDADYTANGTAEYSLDLINLAKEVAPRIALEYADFNSKLNLNKSDDLDQAASIVSERIAVEYADSISTNQLQGSEALNQVAATVTPRLIVEYADFIFTSGLGPKPPEDMTPPVIGIPIQDPPPNIVSPYQNVTILTSITDAGSGVKNATLHYNIDNAATWTATMMSYNATSGFYYAIVPGQSDGTYVRYNITAYDNAENLAIKDGERQDYIIVTEFLSFLILPLFVIATLLAVIVYRRKTLQRETECSHNQKSGKECDGVSVNAD